MVPNYFSKQEGKAEVIANEEGGKAFRADRPSRVFCIKTKIIDRQIPSILSYIEGEEYHGTQAKSQLVRNGKNTIAYFRDFLGKE